MTILFQICSFIKLKCNFQYDIPNNLQKQEIDKQNLLMLPYHFLSHKKVQNKQIQQRLSSEESIFDQIGNLTQTILKLSDNVNKIQEVMKRMENQKWESSKRVDQIQARFRLIQFPFEESLKSDEPSKEQVASWLGLMAKEVFSITFKKFYDGQLDYIQAKCFASESFLYNFLRLSQKKTINEKTLFFIDKKLKFTILPFLSMKYPLSENSEVSLELKKQLKRIDNKDSNQCDLFFKSKCSFEYSDKKQYEYQIMTFLNYIIKVPSLKINSKQKQSEEQEQLFQKFYQYFQELFHRLYVEDEVNQMAGQERKKSKKNLFDIKESKQELKQKLKYKQKVQEYTKYLIGRKISKNFEPFQPGQIKDGKLKLQNASFMRIVTKWCQQLRQKFKSSYQMAHKHGQFRMKDGSERYLSHDEAEVLEKLLERKEQHIQDWLQNIRQNNFHHQIEYSQKKFTQDVDFAILPQQESSVGMFASFNRKNYEFYLINYLKELIHNLLIVMEQFQNIVSYGEKEGWEKTIKENLDYFIAKGKQIKKNQSKVEINSKAVNLITFKLGDLLRCKCQSREREISALYKQIQRVSRQDPQTLKIVRVKDRLQRGTKDILLNLLFKNKILVEVQLSIDNIKSKFIRHSDTFRHYIYELERAQFGPISQLCNIFMNNDLRSDFFKKKIEEKYKGIAQQKCQTKKDIISQINFPFQCEECKRYSRIRHPNSTNICIYCGMKGKNYQDLQKVFQELPEQELQMNKVEIDLNRKQTQLPEFGLIITLNVISKSKVRYFKCINKGRKKFVMVKGKDKKFRNLGEVTTKKQQKQFLQENFIFTHADLQKKTKSIMDQDVNNCYFIPQIFQEVKIKHKNSVRIVHEQLSDEQISLIQEPILSIQKVNLSENRLTKIAQIAEKFPKLKALILNDNDIQNCKGWQKLINLQELKLEENSINFFSISEDQSMNVKNLKILSLSENKLYELNESFGMLKNLQKLNLKLNKLQQLPKSFTELKKLQKLYLQQNSLKNLPDSFCELENLKKLFLNDNQLKKLPESFGLLKSLEELSLFQNKITQLPKSFCELNNLQDLKISDNELEVLEEQFAQLQNLQILEINQNKLKIIPDSFGQLKKLRILEAYGNKINKLPQSLSQLKNLEILALNTNKITELPINLGKLENLKELKLSYNQFHTLPESVKELANLTKFSLDYEQIDRNGRQILNELKKDNPALEF